MSTVVNLKGISALNITGIESAAVAAGVASFIVPQNEQHNVFIAFADSPYTAVANDFVNVDTTAGAVSVVLPLSASNAGKLVTVKLVTVAAAHAVTISTTGGDTIDKAATQSTAILNTAIDMVANGVTGWEIS